MRFNPKYIQLIADALIPLLGFFWWNWSLYFIIVFYLIDYLSNEVFLHIKSKKIVSVQKVKTSDWKINGWISAILLIACFVLIHFAIRSIHPEIQFTKAIYKFWMYKEMGIEQGYILVPLIVLVGFQRYKLEFITANKHKTSNLSHLWKTHLTAHYLVLGSASFIIGLSSFIVFPEIVYILGIVAFSSIYQLTRKDN
jgi:hypothetical protein